MKNKLSRITVIGLIVCIIMLLGSMGLIIYEFNRPIPEAASKPREESVTIELTAVGDNLMHMPLINSGRTNTGYNFDGFYEHIAPYLAKSDMNIINQETVFIDDPSSYSGYPSFGGPSEVGEAVVKAGFNIIQHSSNHSYDKGEIGLRDTYAFWKSKDVILLGINESEEDKLRIDKFEKDGFTIALMNCTYGLNGYILPKGKEYLVNVLKEDEKEFLSGQIAKAKAESDLVIMLPHWGTEYSTTPDEFQKQWLEFFNSNGVDAVIGAHPHVVQGCEEYVGESGNKTLVFYSLGNFISNQEGILKGMGAVAKITFVKDKDGARIEKYSLEPCFTHVENNKYSVYMLSDYTDELAKRHSKYGGSLTVEKIRTKFNEIVGDEIG